MNTVKTCSNCGTAFPCGAMDANNNCWCNTLPNIVPLPEQGDCLCPACLKAKIKEMEGGKDDLNLNRNN